MTTYCAQTPNKVKSDRVRWRPAWRKVMLAVSRRFRPEHMQHLSVLGEILANQLLRKMMKEKQREGKAQVQALVMFRG